MSARYPEPEIDYSQGVSWWRARTKDGSCITSVLAPDAKTARARIRYELDKNPPRRWYLDRWQEDGEIVEKQANG